MAGHVTHFVAYGTYVAPCGWSVSDATRMQVVGTASSWHGGLDGEQPLVTCPGCIAHARREHIYPPLDLPADLSDPAALERWLAS